MDRGAWLLGEMKTREGLPRPDWDAVWDRYQTLTDDEADTAWVAMELLWQERLAAAWPGYRVLRDGDFLLTTDLPDDLAHELLRRMTAYTRRIGKVARSFGCEPPGPGHDIVIACDRVESFLDYISDFDTPDHEGNIGGGMCIRSEPVHAVLLAEDSYSLMKTTAHELAHAALVDLDLPMWLEEGVVGLIEEQVTGFPHYTPPLPDLQDRIRRWTPECIDRFFAGLEFGSPTDGFGLAYWLARVIVERLDRLSRDEFIRFMRSASVEDAGEEACEEIYSCPLDELVPDFVYQSMESA